MENSNLKVALSCSLRYIITALLTFFIYLSVTVIMVGLFTSNIGYTVFSVEDGKSTELYRYYYSEGEDTKYAQYEAQGLQLQKVETRMGLEGKPKVACDTITQILGAVILFGFISNTLKKLGDSDRNLVLTGNMTEDKLRGLKIGIIANAPIYLSYAIFLLAKANILSGNWYALFRFLNFPQFIIINSLYGQATSSAVGIPWSNVALGALTFIVLPLFSYIAYTLGYKRISIGEKIIYKKK